MASTLKDISQLKSQPLIDGSSSTILQSATRSGEGRTLCSQTHTAFPGSIQLLSCPTESSPIMQGWGQNARLEKPTQKLKSAIASTCPMVAGTHPTTPVSDTPANDANIWVMGNNLAMSKRVLTHELHPKYLRYNIWDSGEHFSQSSANWTETASPLPPIPESELANPVIMNTINENQHLFDIITPIFVDQFKEPLESHPNQPFVKSVCHGLCEGFWPWANTHIGDYPDTVNFLLPEPDNPEEAAFL